MYDCTIESLRNKINEQSNEILKLRMLVIKLRHFDQFGCNECPYEAICDNAIFRDCLMDREIDRDMQDLGLGHTKQTDSYGNVFIFDKEESNGE